MFMYVYIYILLIIEQNEDVSPEKMATLCY